MFISLRSLSGTTCCVCWAVTSGVYIRPLPPMLPLCTSTSLALRPMHVCLYLSISWRETQWPVFGNAGNSHAQIHMQTFSCSIYSSISFVLSPPRTHYNSSPFPSSPSSLPKVPKIGMISLIFLAWQQVVIYVRYVSRCNFYPPPAIIIWYAVCSSP